MGYSTFFDGAIKVMPKVDPSTCKNLNVWLNMRHCKSYERPDVQADFSDRAWEPDGPKIPSPDKLIEEFVSKHPKASVFPADEISNYVWVPEPKTKAKPMNVNNYNTEGFPGVSLWSNLRIYQDTDCSYIAWDESEKAYGMDRWFAILVEVLSNIGYKCEGIVRAQGEDYDDRWTIVCENNLCSAVPDHPLQPTYADEIHKIMQKLQTIWE